MLNCIFTALVNYIKATKTSRLIECYLSSFFFSSRQAAMITTIDELQFDVFGLSRQSATQETLNDFSVIEKSKCNFLHCENKSKVLNSPGTAESGTDEDIYGDLFVNLENTEHKFSSLKVFH